MNRWLLSLTLLALLVLGVRASVEQIDQTDDKRTKCSGMYSKKSWGGSVDPYISLKLEKEISEGDSDPLVSIIIYEWRDEMYIGKLASPDDLQKEVICDVRTIEAKLCNDSSLGAYILKDSASQKAQNQISTEAIHLKDPHEIKYSIKKTGYYCVGTYAFSNQDYKGTVEFRNAYGELAAANIAKLPFYGGLTILYAVIGVFWAFLYVQHRSDILPVQNYITAIIIFLVIEMLMTWGFYDYQNRHGSNALAKVLLIIVSILNAGRNSFSFFLLLIVCMGYGVVKPSLGKQMLIVRGLAIAHFVFGVIYAIASLTVTPDTAGPLVLLVILPLAGTLTAFYVWTLNALGMTMKDLIDRKQTVKAMMYKKLWWCILGSVMVIFGFFFINSFTFAGRSNPDFVPEHWQTRWFILDGWLNLVYLFDIGFVAYLWRPTANNRRFAMSDEIAQDDTFEFASVRNSLDDEESGHSGEHTPRFAAPNGNAAPKVEPGARRPRESLDAEETIFAVGEDVDKWSDDESHRDSEERKGLTAKDD